MNNIFRPVFLDGWVANVIFMRVNSFFIPDQEWCMKVSSIFTPSKSTINSARIGFRQRVS